MYTGQFIGNFKLKSVDDDIHWVVQSMNYQQLLQVTNTTDTNDSLTKNQETAYH